VTVTVFAVAAPATSNAPATRKSRALRISMNLLKAVHLQRRAERASTDT
jgi:hypothetical protein